MSGPGTMPPGFAPPPRVRQNPSEWQAEQDALREEAEREEREREIVRNDIGRVIR
jgi:hypothetical protein